MQSTTLATILLVLTAFNTAESKPQPSGLSNCGYLSDCKIRCIDPNKVLPGTGDNEGFNVCALKPLPTGSYALAQCLGSKKSVLESCSAAASRGAHSCPGITTCYLPETSVQTYTDACEKYMGRLSFLKRDAGFFETYEAAKCEVCTSADGTRYPCEPHIFGAR